MKALLNRKLLLMVLGPVFRAGLTLGTGWLTAKGVPEHLVGEFANAVSLTAAGAVNVVWELVDRRKAENRGARMMIEGLR